MRIVIFLPSSVKPGSMESLMAGQLADSLKLGTDVEVVNKLSKIRHHHSSIDVVHVIGCWHLSSARVIKLAYRRGIPIVYTPMQEITTWYRHQHRLACTLKSILYQRSITHKASVIHVTGPVEQSDMEKLGWNHQINLIANPVLTHQINSDELAQRLLIIYHTANENTTQTAQQSAEKAVSKVCKQNFNIEKQICQYIFMIHRRMQRCDIPLAMLKQLSNLLCTQDYDEELIARILRKLHLTNFTRYLETALQKRNLLTEGFMPIAQRNGRLTTKIMQYITEN